jgi:ribonuclease P protein component
MEDIENNKSGLCAPANFQFSIFNFQFKKQERIVSQKQIDALFIGTGSHSKAAFPVRAVYIIKERAKGREPVQLLLSVPKKRFKHAVDRNRVKRQLREAYRHHKHLLIDALPTDKAVDIAFIWLAPSHYPSEVTEKRVVALLTHIAQSTVSS